MLDSPEDVKRKIKKVDLFEACSVVASVFYGSFNWIHSLQAFCEPGNVTDNGVLAFARFVLFPILAGEGIYSCRYIVCVCVHNMY